MDAALARGGASEGEYALEVDGQLITREQFENAQRDKLSNLYQSFAKMRDRWVQHRAQSGVEDRWRRSNALYHGADNDGRGTLRDTLQNGPSKQRAGTQDRSRVVVNIVRPKVDQAVARMCEILLPTDDRNWATQPTPNPELAKSVGDDTQTVDEMGQPTGMTRAVEARAITQAAKEACDKMQQAIDDVLVECHFNSEARKAIENGVRLGSGVLKGPFPARQRSKVWQTQPDGSSSLQVNESIVPATVEVDCWDVFFDPACGNQHQRGRGVWHRRPVTRREIRALVGLPGYDSGALRMVLQSPPKRIRCAEGRVVRESSEDDSYELWEYHGEVEPADVQMVSMRSDEGDPLTDVSFGVIVMINDIVVGAMDSWVEDDTLPYDVWCWRKSDESPYGHGLPEELDNQQSVVNSAWRQVMDNGKATMGGQIVIKKGSIAPIDGQFNIYPMKLWYAKDDVEDVTKAMTVFEFNSHLEELLAVAQAAMAFADQEASMPQLLGGEKGSAPETVGGMVMLYQNASAVLRFRVKMFDDNVIVPHLTRYYDWMMANSEDQSIKGDFEVFARGSTALLEKDIQNQALLNLANITNNPRYIPHLKEREELKMILRAFRVNPDDIMKDEEVVKEEQANVQQPEDPRMASAKMQLEAKQLEMQDRMAQREFEGQRNAEDMQLKRDQLAYNSQREQAEYEIAQTDSEIKRSTALLKIDTDSQVKREAMSSKERLDTLKIENTRQIFNAEAEIKMRQGSGI